MFGSFICKNVLKSKCFYILNAIGRRYQFRHNGSRFSLERSPVFSDFNTVPVGKVCEDEHGGRSHGQRADLCR